MKSVITLLAFTAMASAAIQPNQPFTYQQKLSNTPFTLRTNQGSLVLPGQYSPTTRRSQYINTGIYNTLPSTSTQGSSDDGQYVPGQYSGAYNPLSISSRFGNNDGQYAADNSGVYSPQGGSYPNRYASTSDGQYFPDNTGAYHQGGEYYHDNSGAYIHDNSGEYIHIHNPYEHQDNPYVHKGGEYIHPKNYVSIPPAGGYGAPVNLQRGNAAGLYDNRNYKIIRKIEHVGEDLYDYLYETENGIYAEEDGKLGNKGTKEEAIRAKGYFTYTGPDNIIYTVNYTADENGFLPDAAHLPTPPPTPEYIERSLAYQRSIGELKK
ncbi:hypothetical protein NQ317_004621 [Molorchus minor]|uniref:Uncharacterized protein n=1 Tax=Molorchus minor TaxID=1323400 RepID=A0ABQ9JJN6_9CUCU|nr:hypothetical protein NQ317_004621 [Molorchus minor]